MEAFDVFLSHHSHDKPWVIALKAALVERGVKVWLDKDEIRPGDLFIDALDRGVESSRALALVVTPGSVASRWVKEEFSRALVLANSSSRELRIIPCLREGATVPGFLASRHWVDFRDPSRFEEHVDELCRGIRAREQDGTVESTHSATFPTPDPAATPPRARPVLTGGDVTPAILTQLDRWIASVRTERTRLLAARAGAPLAGPLAVFVTPATDIPALTVLAGAAAVTGLLGIGITARAWSAKTQELKKLEAHRGAMEMCLQEFVRVCPDVVEAFNRDLRQRIGISVGLREVAE
jgi:TIR domain